MNIVGEEKKPKRFRPGLAAKVNAQARAGTLRKASESLDDLLKQVPESFIDEWKEKGFLAYSDKMTDLYERMVNYFCEEYDFEGASKEDFTRLKERYPTVHMVLPFHPTKACSHGVITFGEPEQIGLAEGLKQHLENEKYKLDVVDEQDNGRINWIYELDSKHPFDVKSAVKWVETVLRYVDGKK